MSDYITIPSHSSVDMLRFRLVFNGEPGSAVEWFDKLWADVFIEFGKHGAEGEKKPVRYPLSLRVGSYRDLFVLPAGDSSITVAMGVNAKGEKQELREGFVEFNPAKVYPSRQLEYLYALLDREPSVRLELMRWDFATDYPIARESVVLMRDGRKYACVISESYTSYLGRRNNKGFVKVYDKRAELLKAGKQCIDPRTRVEVTIEEPCNKLGKLWPRLVWLPDSVPEVDNVTLRLIVLAAKHGVDFEEALQGMPARTKARYRNAFGKLLGEFAPPDEFEACRRDALAWERMYGGNGRTWN